MRFKEIAAAEIIKGKAMYNIGFFNEDGIHDETQFDAEGLSELCELWKDFCKENGFDTDAVTYVECIGPAEE